MINNIVLEFTCCLKNVLMSVVFISIVIKIYLSNSFQIKKHFKVFS
jgi:hypothetical protein